MIDNYIKTWAYTWEDPDFFPGNRFGGDNFVFQGVRGGPRPGFGGVFLGEILLLLFRGWWGGGFSTIYVIPYIYFTTASVLMSKNNLVDGVHDYRYVLCSNILT